MSHESERAVAKAIRQGAVEMREETQRSMERTEAMRESIRGVQCRMEGTRDNAGQISAEEDGLTDRFRRELRHFDSNRDRLGAADRERVIDEMADDFTRLAREFALNFAQSTRREDLE
jgi:hypothetical protein